MIDNSYEDTSIFIFRVWVFASYITFSYIQVFFSPQTYFNEVGIPFDPEQSFVHYSWLATYYHVCLSLRGGVKPFLPDGYTNIYPLRIRLRTISISSPLSQLFAGQEMASLHIVGSGVSWTAECILVAITPALYDSPYRLNQWLQR